MATRIPVPVTSWPFHAPAPYSAKAVCPRCNSPLYRVPRRLFDRLLSLFVPVRRYRCSAREKDFTCKWEGLLHSHATDESRLLRQSHEDFGDISFEAMAQISLESIGDGVLVVNPQGKVIYLNRVAETLTGWPRGVAIGCSVEQVFLIVNGTTRQREPSPSQRAIDEGQAVELALGSVLIRRDGTDIAIEDSAAPILNHLGKTAGAVIVFHDASQSRSAIQEMSHLAQHDFLTGLPNRVLLMERLTQAIGMANRHNKQVALLFLDLDNFKTINDSHGHSAGDQLLREVAADIEACLRATDTVSRHGGDEFIVLLTEIEDSQSAAQIAEKLLARFAEPRVVEGQEVQVTLSIGISVYPESGIDAETLMGNADNAMYASKEAGRNSYQFFNRIDNQAAAVAPEKARK